MWTHTQTETELKAFQEVIGALEANTEFKFPDTNIPLLAKLVQDSTLPLAELSQKVYTRLVGESEGASVLTSELINSTITTVAERKSYGLKGKNTIKNEDVDATALWHWEVSYLPNLPKDVEKSLRLSRTQRNSMAKHIAAIARFIELAAKPKWNEAHLSSASDRVEKISREAAASRQRLAEKAEQKRKQQEAKELREKEAEEKKLQNLANKKAKPKSAEKKEKLLQKNKKAASMMRSFFKSTAPEKPKANGTSSDDTDSKASGGKREFAPYTVPAKERILWPWNPPPRCTMAPIHRVDEKTRLSAATLDSSLEQSIEPPEVITLLRKQRVKRKHHIHPTRPSRCSKLLQFEENQRPAWWGRYPRWSMVVLPRSGFGHDPSLNYTIDSDEEWCNEPEDAEDLNSSEGITLITHHT